MSLSLFNRRICMHGTSRRKILIAGVCCSLFICAVFKRMTTRCCQDQSNSSGFQSQLFQNIIDTTMNIVYESGTCFHHRQTNFDCKKLAMGDREEIQKAIKDIKHNKTENLCRLSNLAENCTALKSEHNYITDVKMILPEEVQFPLAFTIKMHKSPEQAEQLLRTIYRPQNVYCVYIDKKAEPDVFNIMKKIGDCFKNIYIVEKRISIVYSSINLVEAELECMRILTGANSSWKYYINLTGQEFPLKTNYEIVKILKILNGANDIESYDFPFFYQQRYTKQYVIKGDVIIKTKQLKSAFIRRFQMSKGSAYGTFSRPFVEFIISDNVSFKFLKWLNGSYAPEESAWATLNSLPWAPGGYPRETRHSLNSFISRAVIWSWDGIKCHGHYVRGICVYGSRDLPWLISRSELFANKFDVDRDSIVIDCLEEILNSRAKENKIENLNWNFYSTLPHVAYYANLTSLHKSKDYLQEKKNVWLKEHNITKLYIDNLKY